MFHAPKTDDWLPSASLETLRARATLLEQIRSFFKQREVLEVETPLLCQTAATDPAIEPLKVQPHFYLQTSPEYAMKRLLCAGLGSIYQLCKAFRSEEQGRFHQVEFTMLEWYRVGWDHHQLMNDVDALLHLSLGAPSGLRITYSDLFTHYVQFDPLLESLERLKTCISRYEWSLRLPLESLTHDDCCHLLMNHCIEPHLGFDRPVFVVDYPASQAALAATRPRFDGVFVADRFEVYVNGIELANGYYELTDPAVYESRALRDRLKRKELGLADIAIDPYLLAALTAGLPTCAGIALGIDRLLMLKLGLKSIAEALSFEGHRV